MIEKGGSLSAIERFRYSFPFIFRFIVKARCWLIHCQREVLGYFSGIEIKENEYYDGEAHRYFERVGDYKAGGRPTVGGPHSYIIQIIKVEKRRVCYKSEILVFNRQGVCEQDLLSANKWTSINQLKYEIKAGHLSPMKDVLAPFPDSLAPLGESLAPIKDYQADAEL